MTKKQGIFYWLNANVGNLVSSHKLYRDSDSTSSLIRHPSLVSKLNPHYHFRYENGAVKRLSPQLYTVLNAFFDHDHHDLVEICNDWIYNGRPRID